ncbi:unnamed protein product [Ilex paraguariensis]|uniref:Uncharacterized protein n=1 Tax=Ilex paraguariensis TaxID=185542 RepID=A0ABC8UII6_9AQUA
MNSPSRSRVIFLEAPRPQDFALRMSRREGRDSDSNRREGRDSDSKRHRSRFDQEPSPKRSRRDGKPVTERPFPPNSLNLDGGDQSARDQKHRRRLQDALPLEAPVAPDPKVQTGALNKETDNKTNGDRDGAKQSSESTEVPRSRSFFQHDDRGSARQVGRSFSRRAGTGEFPHLSFSISLNIIMADVYLCHLFCPSYFYNI